MLTAKHSENETTIEIEFSPEQEAAITEAAQIAGVTVQELVQEASKRLLEKAKEIDT